MAHPCASKNKPSWCNKKKRKSKRKSSCACPSGWDRQGFMCVKGKQRKRSSCAAKPKRRRSKRR